MVSPARRDVKKSKKRDGNVVFGKGRWLSDRRRRGESDHRGWNERNLESSPLASR